MADSAVAPTLVIRGETVELRQPLVMGILDAGEPADTESRVARAKELAAQGATIVDVGGIPVPVVEDICTACPDVLVAVDVRSPADVEAVLAAGIGLVVMPDELAAVTERGAPAESLILEAGADVAAAHRLGRPVLVDLSAEDLVRTLAAVGQLADTPGVIFRVHDVDAVADYLAVRATLTGRSALPPDAMLAVELRREPPASAST